MTISSNRNPVLDSRTGLPKVPEGYFWRVYESDYGRYPYIALRKEVTLFGARIGSRLIKEAMLSSTYNDVLEEAYGVYRKVFSPQWYTNVLGDYPPNKLDAWGD